VLQGVNSGSESLTFFPLLLFLVEGDGYFKLPSFLLAPGVK